MCGSVSRQIFSSSVGTEKLTLDVGDLGELEQRSRSRSTSGDLVRIEVGVSASRSASSIGGISSYRPSAHWYGSVLVPNATSSRFQLGLRELGAQQLRHVDLDDDLPLEVSAGVQVEVGVGIAGEAVGAGMRAAPERVDRPVEREVVAGHLVERRLGPDLVEVDAEGLRSIEGPDAFDVEAREASSLLSIDSL